MQENINLIEGRLTGSLNYKDFLTRDPNWYVGPDDGKAEPSVRTRNYLKTISISEFLQDQEVLKEAFSCAVKIIKAIYTDMLDRKPNELKDVMDSNIYYYNLAYFGDSNSDLTAEEVYANALATAKKYTNTGSLDSRTKRQLLTKVHQAAFAEALVRKYYAQKLKDSTNRKSGLKRALNNMSIEDKEAAKAWFKDHVTGIKFKIPFIDDESDIVFYTLDDAEDVEKENNVINNLEAIKDYFERKYPNAKEGEDFIYRHTANSDDTRKDLWNLAADVTFDTKVADVPNNIKTIIADAKRQATQETKSMTQMADDYTVSSVPLAQAILDLFNNDFNFYKKQKDDSLINNGLDALINDYID